MSVTRATSAVIGIGADLENLTSASLIGLGLLNGKTAGRTADVGAAQRDVPHDRTERDVDEAAGPGLLRACEAVTPTHMPWQLDYRSARSNSHM